jgi:hypothetical protein
MQKITLSTISQSSSAADTWIAYRASFLSKLRHVRERHDVAWRIGRLKHIGAEPEAARVTESGRTILPA